MTTAPLVGQHFRPPAKAVLAALPLGHPLQLIPEPTNPYDPNAVAIWLDTATLSGPIADELALTLPGFGFELSELPARIHLGYMDAKNGHAGQWHEPLARAIALQQEDAATSGDPIAKYWPPPDYWPATLSFSGDGKYQITFEV